MESVTVNMAMPSGTSLTKHHLGAFHLGPVVQPDTFQYHEVFARIERQAPKRYHSICVIS